MSKAKTFVDLDAASTWADADNRALDVEDTLNAETIETWEASTHAADVIEVTSTYKAHDFDDIRSSIDVEAKHYVVVLFDERDPDGGWIENLSAERMFGTKDEAIQHLNELKTRS